MSINRRGFFLATLLVFFAQYLLHRHLRLFDILPDLVLIHVIFVNLSVPGAPGLATAFLSGFYQDFLLRAAPGGNSIVYLAVAYLAGRFQPEGRRFTIPTVFLACAGFSFLAALLHQFIGEIPPSGAPHLFWKPLFFALVNACAALPVFAVCRHLCAEESHGSI